MSKAKSVYLSDEAIKKIQKIADREIRSFSEIIEKLIKEFKPEKK